MWTPGVVSGLKKLRESGYRIIVVSNQQAVGLKLVDANTLDVLTKRIKDAFSSEGVYFDAFYYCRMR